MNTPACLGSFFKLINETSLESLEEEQKYGLHKEFSTIMYCLGLRLDDKEQGVEVPEEIKRLAESRWQAKQSKNFIEADRLRQELSNYGWTVKDSPSTYTIEKDEP
jgi:cysteinyl-tRNA synthetase